MMFMTQLVRHPALDDNLHHAIDLLQVIVLNLDVLKQQPEIAGTPLVKQLDILTRHVFQCSNLLHEACEENREVSPAECSSTLDHSIQV